MKKSGKTLQEIEVARAKLRTLQDELGAMQERRMAELAEEGGLVPGHTIIRDRDSNKVGIFLRLRGSSGGWAKVRLMKKNGEPGLREGTFYQWDKDS